MESCRDLTSNKLKYFTESIRNTLPDVDIFVRKSTISDSHYLYVVGKDSAICVRISDHIREINPKRLRFETKKKEVKDFYYFVTGNFGKYKEFYYMNEENKLVKDIMEFFGVLSEETE